MKLTEIIIIETVADYFNVPVDKVLSTCKKKEYVKARQVSMYFIKECFDKKAPNRRLTLSKIGKKFNGRVKYKDHATVMHAIKTVKNEIETNKCYKKDIDYIRAKFNPKEIKEPVKPSIIEVQESILICENRHLREVIIGLKSEISSLQGVIYGLKLNRRRVIKKVNPFREVKPVAEIKPEKTIDKEAVYVRPFENIPTELHFYKSCVI